MLNSEIEYFFKDWRSYKPIPCRAAHTKRAKHGSFPPWVHVSICKLPREPFSIYGGKETMHLLMTTYRQDIMTNFGCMCNRSTVMYLPMFQGSFPKHTQAYKHTCQPTFSCWRALFYYSIVQIIKVILNFQWFWYKSHVCIRFIHVDFMQIDSFTVHSWRFTCFL